MITQIYKKMSTIAFVSGIQRNTLLKNNRTRTGSILVAGLLIATLAGCATESAEKPVGKISLNQDPLVIAQGDTIQLQAHNSVFHTAGDWKYQWQTVVGDVGTDIPDATQKKLVLKRVVLKDGQLYRCKIYQTGDLGETNYTSVIGLEVTVHGLMQTLGETTIVSGPYQPGGTSPAPKGSCCYGCTNWMQLVSPSNSIWWAPDTGATNGVFTFTPTAGQTAQLMVINSGGLQTNAPWCSSDNTVSFPILSGRRYMMIVCFLSNPPVKGTPLSFTVTWN